MTKNKSSQQSLEEQTQKYMQNFNKPILDGHTRILFDNSALSLDKDSDIITCMAYQQALRYLVDQEFEFFIGKYQMDEFWENQRSPKGEHLANHTTKLRYINITRSLYESFETKDRVLEDTIPISNKMHGLMKRFEVNKRKRSLLDVCLNENCAFATKNFRLVRCARELHRTEGKMIELYSNISGQFEYLPLR